MTDKCWIYDHTYCPENLSSYYSLKCSLKDKPKPKSVSAVAGLMFSADRKYVCLLRKNRPKVCKGFWCAPGGKVEEGEGAFQAVAREFREETGVQTGSGDWNFLAELEGQNFAVRFYYTFTDKVKESKTTTDEPVSLFPIWATQGDEFGLMPNLRVLIPLALDTSGIVKPVMLKDSTHNEE